MYSIDFPYSLIWDPAGMRSLNKFQTSWPSTGVAADFPLILRDITQLYLS